MPEPISEAFVEVRAQFDRLERELNQATQATRRTAGRMERNFRRVERAGDRVRRTFAGVGTAIAGLLTIAAIRSATQGALDLADSLDKASLRLGISVEELQSLRFAAQQAGIGTVELDTALQYLNRNLIDARAGIGEAVAAFEELGAVTGENILQLSAGQAFEEIARAFGEIDDPARRVAYAMDIFGRSGARLLQLIGTGLGPLETLKRQFEELNITIGTEQVKALVEAKDRFSALATVIQFRLAKVIIDLQPYLDSFISLIEKLSNAASIIGADLEKLFGSGPDLTTLAGVNRELTSLNQRISQLRALDDIQPLSDENLALVIRLENEFEEILAIKRRILNEDGPLFAAGGDDLNIDAIKEAQQELFELTQKRLELEGRFEALRQRQYEADLASIRAKTGITEATREALLLERQRVELAALEAEESARAQAAAEFELDRLQELSEKNREFTQRIQDDLESAFTSAFDRILQDGKVTFDELGRALTEALLETALQQVVRQIATLFAGTLSGPTSALGGFFGLANGGIIRRPTLVAAGEKGAEAIVPLDRLGELGGSVVQVINATGQASRTSEEKMGDGRSLTRVIVGEVANDIANRGQVYRALAKTGNFRGKSVRR